MMKNKNETDNKKILFIAYSFYPDNAIEAVRPTKLVKYLKKNRNCSCDVVTVETDYPKQKFSNDDIYYDNIYKVNVNNKTLEDQSKNDNKINRETKKKYYRMLPKFVREILMMFLNYMYYFKAKKILRKIDLSKYDAVFSTYGPEFSHLTASYVKKKNKDIIWIADFRDPVYNPLFHSRLLKKYKKSFVNKKCKNADFITSVSTDSIKSLHSKKQNQVITLNNGYDLEDYERNKVNKFQKFTFLTIGNLYEGERSVIPVIQAVKELINKGKINADNVQFAYIGNKSDSLAEELAKFNLENLLLDMGYVTRDESIRIQSKSHILLLPSWNYKNYEGVIPGKFYEFLVSGTPMIAVIEGNKSNSELRRYIRDTNSGVSYENDTKENDFLLIKKYIKDIYNSFINNEVYKTQLNVKETEKYNYSYISNKLFNIIQKK